MQVSLNPTISNQTFSGKKCILSRKTSRDAVSRMYSLKSIKAEKDWSSAAEKTPNLEQWYSGKKNSLSSKQYNSAVCDCVRKFAKMEYYRIMSFVSLLGW